MDVFFSWRLLFLILSSFLLLATPFTSLQRTITILCIITCSWLRHRAFIHTIIAFTPFHCWIWAFINRTRWGFEGTLKYWTSLRHWLIHGIIYYIRAVLILDLGELKWLRVYQNSINVVCLFSAIAVLWSCAFDTSNFRLPHSTTSSFEFRSPST